MADIEYKLEQGSEFFRISANTGGRLVGIVYAEAEGSETKFWGLEVAPIERNNGIGTGLVERLTKIAKEKGAEKLVGELAQDYRRSGAIDFYEKRGFTVDESKGIISRKL